MRTAPDELPGLHPSAGLGTPDVMCGARWGQVASHGEVSQSGDNLNNGGDPITISARYAISRLYAVRFGNKPRVAIEASGKAVRGDGTANSSSQPSCRGRRARRWQS